MRRTRKRPRKLPNVGIVKIRRRNAFVQRPGGQSGPVKRIRPDVAS